MNGGTGLKRKKNLEGKKADTPRAASWADKRAQFLGSTQLLHLERMDSHVGFLSAMSRSLEGISERYMPSYSARSGTVPENETPERQEHAR